MAIPNLLEPCGTQFNMGLSLGMEPAALNPRKKNRWMFNIPSICGAGVPTLPPKKSARPSISLKEFEFHHVNETIWYPMRPEWKPIQVTLYDVSCKVNPIFSWLKTIYDPSNDTSSFGSPINIKTQEALLQLYDGCGNVMEQWTFENVYPSEINWGELDMGEADIVVVELTLRYDRAYVEDGN